MSDRCRLALRASMKYLGMLLAVVAIAAAVAFADDGQLQEFGSMALDFYQSSDCCWIHEDLSWRGFRNGLHAKLLAAAWTEPTPFPLDNDAALSRHVESAQHSEDLSDHVDLFLWSGHSFLADEDHGAQPHFVSEHMVPGQCECLRDCGNLNHEEVGLGPDDCEVALLVTCEFLRNYNNPTTIKRIKKMHQGCHLICGFATMAYCFGKSYPYPAGNYLGRKLLGNQPENPSTILNSWLALTNYWQPTGTIGRVSYWSGDCDHDYLQGNWRYSEPGWGYGGQPPACNDSNLNQFDFWDRRSS